MSHDVSAGNRDNPGTARGTAPHQESAVADPRGAASYTRRPIPTNTGAKTVDGWGAASIRR